MICVGVLEKGEDLFEGLTRICEEYGIRQGVIATGIGMLTDFKVGYFDGREYHVEEHNTPYEVLAMQGTIASGERRFHVHAALSGPDHRAIGGHILEAKVDPTLEVAVVPVEYVEMRRVQRGALWVLEVSR